MARYFNGKEIELLAPAGTFEIFESVIRSKCDAVYFGGPYLNMRMMRKGYNLTIEEAEKAVAIAHDAGKKAYVAVNNLINHEELGQTEAYLQRLDRIAPDAIIVQDYAVLAIVRDMGLNLPIHASVMMNVHNLEMIRFLQERGVTRVVASREMDLRTAESLQRQTGIEIEYFVHGDMCSVHGANCLYSSLLFGNSSNRGRCLKPCRWSYRMKKDGYIYPTEYPLAAKDMYMYEHIPELIQAGICSFKIEGRMRDKEFLTMLVDSYGDAIDRYIEDPVGFDRRQDAGHLYDCRKRDFSTAYAFGKPGLSFINRRYEGTGKFYSTGKVFSTPTAEREMNADRLEEVRRALIEVGKDAREDALLSPACGQTADVPQLSVRVNNMAQAEAAIEAGADHIYLSGDVFMPDMPFTKREIEQLGAAKRGAKLYLSMPRMMTELHFEQYGQLLSGARLPIDGLLVTNVGAIRKFRELGYPLIGDYCLNIYNELAARMYREFGLVRIAPSIELNTADFAALIRNAPLPVEIVAHGSPVVMYMELDLYENAEVFEPIGEEDNRYVDNRHAVLMTDQGENPVYRDHHGRNHMTLAKELCYLPLVPELLQAGVSFFRIEGCTYTPEQLRGIVQAYKHALEAPEQAAEIFGRMSPVYAGYTLGTLSFG
ncbi:peptidase U32 family protein [Paenibacillus sp. MSJ-34]|uniref:peptidase U32 family protein n=1 Tax=Paenibacillus sp. MSJ-34 TaxID=2841529 RepID=UPI001C11C8DE|nr:U32 family peptidase [Paenibacillus sp. MSJ-34]MBU5440678.1 U32 family peptidase [Paenibacillus sp. MSJ-34]